MRRACLRIVRARLGLVFVMLPFFWNGASTTQTRPSTDHLAETCRAFWSATKDSDDLDLIIRFPQLARWQQRLVAVGDPVLREKNERKLKASSDFEMIGAVAWTTDGSRRLLPRVWSELITTPRAATTADGRLHVVFGALTGPTHSISTTPYTLWSAGFDGRAWSKPERLPASASGSFSWDNISPSALVASGSVLDIAIPFKSHDDTGIVVLHRDGAGRWTSHPVVTGEAAAYVRLARIGETMILTWAGPDPRVREDRTSVLAARSMDNGKRWSTPTLVHRAARGTTNDHVLVSDPTGTTFLFWHQRSADPFRASDTLAVAASRDSGKTWHERSGLAVPNGFGSLTAVATQRGPLVAYDDFGNKTSQLALLRDDHWIVPSVAKGSHAVTSALLATVDDQVFAIGARGDVAPARPDRQLFTITLDCQKGSSSPH